MESIYEGNNFVVDLLEVSGIVLNNWTITITLKSGNQIQVDCTPADTNYYEEAGRQYGKIVTAWKEYKKQLKTP